MINNECLRATLMQQTQVCFIRLMNDSENDYTTQNGSKTQPGVQHLLYQLLIITQAPLAPPSQTPNSDKFQLCEGAVLRHAQDIV